MFNARLQIGQVPPATFLRQGTYDLPVSFYRCVSNQEEGHSIMPSDAFLL